MADSKTWIDVAESAVLIGLGAIVGGFTRIWLAKINNKHVVNTTNQERKKRIIEVVLEYVDKFSRTASLFWVLRANAANKLENKKYLTLPWFVSSRTKQQPKERFLSFLLILN